MATNLATWTCKHCGKEAEIEAGHVETMFQLFLQLVCPQCGRLPEPGTLVDLHVTHPRRNFVLTKE